MKHTIKLLTLAFTLAAILTLTGCPGPVNTVVPCTHENKNTETVTAATCTETGLEKIICADCGELIEENTIEALGHDFGEWTVTKEATCTADGEETRTCKREGCTHSETRPIKAHHHVDYEKSGYCETCKMYKFESLENHFTIRVYTSKDDFRADNFDSNLILSSNNENNSPYDECKFSFESENPSMTLNTLIHKKLRYQNYSVVAYKLKNNIVDTNNENEKDISTIYSIYIEPQTN